MAKFCRVCEAISTRSVLKYCDFTKTNRKHDVARSLFEELRCIAVANSLLILFA